ncbi:MAG: hypothetical protein ABR562_08400 [Thermoplasmatota archaeon]
MTGRPSDYRSVVHPLRMETRVFLVASTHPCIRIRDEAAKPTGRDYRTVDAGELAALDPPRQWVLAVLLCPGDDAAEVVAWLGAHGGDPDRVLFILHPGTDAVAALRPWYAAGFPDAVAIEAAAWGQLAKPLGQFVNDWIYAQAKGMGWPL